tara:strand:+ start:128 stop:328 length:201 start_codon:yes stop_codon:yes gene_type:complete
MNRFRSAVDGVEFGYEQTPYGLTLYFEGCDPCDFVIGDHRAYPKAVYRELLSLCASVEKRLEALGA